MIHDTIRVLLDWKCNLKCPYCCNEQDRFRSQFASVPISSIDFNAYKVVCISGGEPLMFMDRLEYIAKLAEGQFKVLYSNGLLMTKEIVDRLVAAKIDAINIGLHYPQTFDRIIRNVHAVTRNTGISARFHVWEDYKEIENEYDVSFRFWTMNDCDRDNERRVVLDWDGTNVLS